MARGTFCGGGSSHSTAKVDEASALALCEKNPQRSVPTAGDSQEALLEAGEAFECFEKWNSSTPVANCSSREDGRRCLSGDGDKPTSGRAAATPHACEEREYPTKASALPFGKDSARSALALPGLCEETPDSLLADTRTLQGGSDSRRALALALSLSAGEAAQTGVAGEGSLWTASAARPASQREGLASPPLKTSWLTQQQVCERFCLNEEALRTAVAAGKLEVRLRPNPKSAAFKPMKLYREGQAQDLAVSVWGSLEAVFDEREKRIERRWQKKTQKNFADEWKRKRSREEAPGDALARRSSQSPTPSAPFPETSLKRPLPAPPANCEWEEI